MTLRPRRRSSGGFRCAYPPYARHVPAGTASTVIGLPFAALTLLPLPLLGSSPTLAGMAVAALCMFARFMPLLAVAAGGVSQGGDVTLTPRRYATLLVLWIVADALGMLMA